MLYITMNTIQAFTMTIKKKTNIVVPHELHELYDYEQDAQLSQRDRTAGCVIVFAKSRTLELGDNDLRTL